MEKRTPEEEFSRIYDIVSDFIHTSEAHFSDRDAEKNIALFFVRDKIKTIRSFQHLVDNSEEVEYWEEVEAQINKFRSYPY